MSESEKTPSQIAEELAEQRRREGKEYDPNITRSPEEDVRQGSSQPGQTPSGETKHGQSGQSPSGQPSSSAS